MANDRVSLRRWWPLLVPVVATGLVLGVQPGDQLGVPGEYPFASRVAYDDADMAAFALRGINANRGDRKPGPVEPELLTPGVFSGNLFDGRHPPLQDRYFLEYPHAALYLFRAVMACVPVEGSWPTTVLDCHYANIIFHHPQTADERAMWTTFRRAARVFLVINVAALLALMAVLLRGLGPAGTLSGPVWLLVLPASLYFTMCRFDVLPSLFVVLGLAAAGRSRGFASGVCLGLATALKLYPLVIAPLVWRHMTTDVKSGVRWAAGFLVPLAVIFGSGIAFDGLDGVLAPFQFQLGRKLEPEWVLYDRLLPKDMAHSSLARLGPLAGVAGLLFLLKPLGMESLLRRAAVVLIVFASLQVFFSPQWLLWFVPLLVPLARRSWTLLALLVAFDLLTFASFPLLFDRMFDDAGGPLTYGAGPLAVSSLDLREGLIFGRGLLLIALLAWLAWDELRAWRMRFTPPPASTAHR